MSRSVNPKLAGPDWRIRLDEIERAVADASMREFWLRSFERPPGSALELTVDIGFGRGEFIAELARRDPAGAYLGIERSWKRVLKVAKRLAATEISNVRLLSAHAEWVVREALDAGSVRAFWINFPDPWPKRRHHARRLVDASFVADLVRALRPGGALHVATDHREYACAIDAVLSCERQLDNALAPDRHRGERRETPTTAYEREWLSEGRECVYFHYRRRARA